jgi:hypothetical protein
LKGSALIAVPVGVMTRIWPLVAPAGTLTTISVALTDTMVAAVLANVTLVAAAKPCPVMVMVRPHRPRLRGETADLRRDCSGDPRNGVVVGGPQRTVGPSCDPLGEAEARRNEFRYHPGGRDSPDRILGEVGEPKRAVRPGGDPGRFVDAGGGVGGDRPGGGDPPDRVALEVHTDDPASLADEAARVGARLESSPSALAALRSPAGLRFEAIA